MTDYRLTLWNLLTSDEYVRLCECRSLKEDILPIARCFMVNRHKSPEDAIISTLEHLDWNNQFFDLTREERNELLTKLNA